MKISYLYIDKESPTGMLLIFVTICLIGSPDLWAAGRVPVGLLQTDLKGYRRGSPPIRQR